MWNTCDLVDIPCMWKTANTLSTFKKNKKRDNTECSSIWIPCRSLGLSATSQQYFSLTTNQPSATSQQYSCLRTNQHQPSATSQPNMLSGSEAASLSPYLALCHACGSCQPVPNLTKKRLSAKINRGHFPHKTHITTCDCKVSVLPTKSSIFSPRSNICPSTVRDS
jgi:hypothetical protein